MLPEIAHMQYDFDYYGSMDSLNETLSTFERAKKDDLINEKLPPSLDQVERDNKEKLSKKK